MLTRTLDRPTWNRTKIFGSKGSSGHSDTLKAEGQQPHASPRMPAPPRSMRPMMRPMRPDVSVSCMGATPPGKRRIDWARVSGLLAHAAAWCLIAVGAHCTVRAWHG